MAVEVKEMTPLNMAEALTRLNGKVASYVALVESCAAVMSPQLSAEQILHVGKVLDEASSNLRSELWGWDNPPPISPIKLPKN